jgi:hypothetical protein
VKETEVACEFHQARLTARRRRNDSVIIGRRRMCCLLSLPCLRRRSPQTRICGEANLRVLEADTD